MPIVYQKVICRADLQANPDVIYLFGDNDRRKGLGGQAKEMRGEFNSVGIRTKWAPLKDETAFFSDNDYNKIKAMWIADFADVRTHFRMDGVVVIPLAGLGTGRAELPARAPRLYKLLQRFIVTLGISNSRVTLDLNT